MDNLKVFGMTLDDLHRQFCEEENIYAPEQVIEAREAYYAALDEYIAAVTDFDWKCGFWYAVKLLDQEKGGDRIALPIN